MQLLLLVQLLLSSAAGAAALSATDALALRGAVLDGAVLLPGEAGFADACRIKMRGTCRPSAPDVVVQPRSARDVIAAVRFAKRQRDEGRWGASAGAGAGTGAGASSLPLTIKAGGHSYSCESSALGGLLLELHAGMDWVEPFVVRGGEATATIGAGAVFEQVDAVLEPLGWVMLHGAGAGVGVGGYITSGGVNIYFAAGIAAHQVLRARFVLASGELVEAHERGLRFLAPPHRAGALGYGGSGSGSGTGRAAGAPRVLRSIRDNSLWRALHHGAAKGLGVLLDIDVRLTPATALAQRLQTMVPADKMPLLMPDLAAAMRDMPREMHLHCMMGNRFDRRTHKFFSLSLTAVTTCADGCRADFDLTQSALFRLLTTKWAGVLRSPMQVERGAYHQPHPQHPDWDVFGTGMAELRAAKRARGGAAVGNEEGMWGPQWWIKQASVARNSYGGPLLGDYGCVAGGLCALGGLQHPVYASFCAVLPLPRWLEVAPAVLRAATAAPIAFLPYVSPSHRACACYFWFMPWPRVEASLARARSGEGAAAAAAAAGREVFIDFGCTWQDGAHGSNRRNECQLHTQAVRAAAGLGSSAQDAAGGAARHTNYWNTVTHEEAATIQREEHAATRLHWWGGSATFRLWRQLKARLDPLQLFGRLYDNRRARAASFAKFATVDAADPADRPLHLHAQHALVPAMATLEEAGAALMAIVDARVEVRCPGCDDGAGGGDWVVDLRSTLLHVASPLRRGPSVVPGKLAAGRADVVATFASATAFAAVQSGVMSPMMAVQGEGLAVEGDIATLTRLWLALRATPLLAEVSRDATRTAHYREIIAARARSRGAAGEAPTQPAGSADPGVPQIATATDILALLVVELGAGEMAAARMSPSRAAKLVCAAQSGPELEAVIGSAMTTNIVASDMAEHHPLLALLTNPLAIAAALLGCAKCCVGAARRCRRKKHDA